MPTAAAAHARRLRPADLAPCRTARGAQLRSQPRRSHRALTDLLRPPTASDSAEQLNDTTLTEGLPDHQATAITVRLPLLSETLPLLSDTPEAGRRWLPGRCAAPSRHIRHCSLSMTFLCLQVDGVVTDVDTFPVRLLLPPGRRRKMHACRPGQHSVVKARRSSSGRCDLSDFCRKFCLTLVAFPLHFLSFSSFFSRIMYAEKQIGCYLARR